MADVTSSVTLPANPATGTQRRVPLGGNGFTAPSAMYVVRNFAAVGDGSDLGDFSSCQIGMDPLYCWMVGYCSASVSQATPANQVMKFQLVGAGFATAQENITAGFQTFVAPSLAEIWYPPATVQPGGASPGTLSVFTENVGTDTLLFNAQIFLYDIRARESALFAHLVAARGGK